MPGPRNGFPAGPRPPQDIASGLSGSPAQTNEWETVPAWNGTLFSLRLHTGLVVSIGGRLPARANALERAPQLVKRRRLRFDDGPRRTLDGGAGDVAHQVVGILMVYCHQISVEKVDCTIFHKAPGSAVTQLRRGSCFQPIHIHFQSGIGLRYF
jgi:hypothetical protein